MEALDGSPERGLNPFADFVGVQLLLFGTLPFGVFAWVVLEPADCSPHPRLRVCACLFAFPFAFFLYKATRGPLEGNWALACYIAVWPLAAALVRAGPVLASAGGGRLAGGVRLPAAASWSCPVHLLAAPLPVVKPRHDRLTRHAARQEAFAELASVIRRHGEPLPVFVASYQWTAHCCGSTGSTPEQIDGVTRPSHFTQPPGHPGRP